MRVNHLLRHAGEPSDCGLNPLGFCRFVYRELWTAALELRTPGQIDTPFLTLSFPDSIS